MRHEQRDDAVTLGPAPDIELAELLPLWTEVFTQPASVFDGVWATCPPGRRHTFIARAPEGIVASVQLYVLPLRTETGEAEAVGCIANVATRPEYRKQGLSSDLLRLAIERMEEMDCGWSYLFTGVPEHYAKLGWASQARTAYVVDPASLPATEGIKTRRLTEADLSAVRTLYERHHAGTPASLARTDVDWSAKIPGRFAWRTTYGIGDPLTAYAVVGREGNDVVVGEWAASSTEEYAALLAAAAQPEHERLILSAPVPPEAESLIAGSVELSHSAGMSRPIAPRWTSERLAALLRAPHAKLSFLDNF